MKMLDFARYLCLIVAYSLFFNAAIFGDEEDEINRQFKQTESKIINTIFKSQSQKGTWKFQKNGLLFAGLDSEDSESDYASLVSLPQIALMLSNHTIHEGMYEKKSRLAFSVSGKLLSNKKTTISSDMENTRLQAIHAKSVFEQYSRTKDAIARELSENALANLLAIQNDDGGWGLSSEKSDIVSTVLVLDAIGIACQAGVVELDSLRLKDIANYVKNQKSSTSLEHVALAYSHFLIGSQYSEKLIKEMLTLNAPSDDPGIYRYFLAKNMRTYLSIEDYQKWILNEKVEFIKTVEKNFSKNDHLDSSVLFWYIGIKVNEHGGTKIVKESVFDLE